MTAFAPVQPRSHPRGDGWNWVAIATLIPGLLYAATLVAGILGDRRPAQWLLEHVLTTGAAIPLASIVVVGGPVISVMACLIIGSRSSGGSQRLAQICGAASLAAILINILAGMFFLPFIFLD